jgi:hypothetical protein
MSGSGANAEALRWQHHGSFQTGPSGCMDHSQVTSEKNGYRE